MHGIMSHSAGGAVVSRPGLLRYGITFSGCSIPTITAEGERGLHDIEDLRQRQALPLRAKVLMSQSRISEWFNHWNGAVYVSFSGGKDSTVLAHLVHDLFPEVPLVFSNTGLEYPEIQAFACKMGAEFVRPKMQFSEVISTYGYPIISKEIAEALYYARRIRNGDDGPEFPGAQKPGAGYRGHLLAGQPEPETQARKYGYKRNQFLGGYIKDADGRQVAVHDIEAQRRRAQLNGPEVYADWWRASFQGDGPFAESKSLFNKERWLPLCQETQFMISHRCCDAMKKGPMHAYESAHKSFPIIGTLTEESKMREQAWLRHGCNAFDGKKKTSTPLSFWREQDVLQYIKEQGLEIASVYGEIVTVGPDGMQYDSPLIPCGKLQCTGCQRTGCIFCGFGCHLEKGETRFQRLARTHPKQYEYCMMGGAMGRQSPV